MMRQTVWATRGRLKQATREELRNSRHGQRAEIESSLFVPEEAAPSLFGLYKPLDIGDACSFCTLHSAVFRF